MAIYFYVYPSAFQNPGGGEVQLLKTKEYLEKRGLEICLYDQWNNQLKSGDLLHIFGSVKYCYGLMRTAKEVGAKVLLSTICWSDWRSALHTYPSWGQRSLNLIRHAAKVLFPKIPSLRRSMMEIADRLLPNSQAEAKQLVRYFGMKRDKIVVVPNGVDSHYEQADPQPFYSRYGLRDFFLLVISLTEEIVGQLILLVNLQTRQQKILGRAIVTQSKMDDREVRQEYRVALVKIQGFLQAALSRLEVSLCYL